MKVTNENIDNIEFIYDFFNRKNKIEILKGLMIDLMELNQLLEDKGESYRKLYIDYIDEHTEYSPERTDPCPDYYGMFRLRFENDPYETVGLEMTIDELDTILCALINFMEFKLS